MIQVVPMEQSFFRDYRQHYRRLYTKRTTDLDKKPVDFCNIVWFNFGKGNEITMELWCFMIARMKFGHDTHIKMSTKNPSVYHTSIKEKGSLVQSVPNPNQEGKGQWFKETHFTVCTLKITSFYSELPCYEDDGDSSDENLWLEFRIPITIIIIVVTLLLTELNYVTLKRNLE